MPTDKIATLRAYVQGMRGGCAGGVADPDGTLRYDLYLDLIDQIDVLAAAHASPQREGAQDESEIANGRWVGYDGRIFVVLGTGPIEEHGGAISDPVYFETFEDLEKALGPITITREGGAPADG